MVRVEAQVARGTGSSFLNASRARPSLALAGAAGLAGWAGVIVIAHLWGRQIIDAGTRIQLGPGAGAPPIVGEVDLRLGLRILPALALATVGVAWAPTLAVRLGWRRLLAAAALGSAAFAVVLAVIDPGGLTRPLLGRGEYLHDVVRVGSPLRFLEGFTDRLPTYNTHTQGHPPGMVLLLWLLDRAGLGGATGAATLVIAGGAAAVPAALVAIRAVAGEAPARAAAPFLVLAPAAIWVASSADGLYMGVVAAGIALLALAGASRGRSADLLAAGAGLVLGAACFLSYGAVLAAPIAGGVALAQRRVRPLVVAAGAGLAVGVAFAAAGFWWPDGLAATRQAYVAGVASRRPYGYFLVANLAALALVVGPAAAVALSRLLTARPFPPATARLGLVVGGAAAAVLLADLSGLSKGEVERIWLFFTPWLLAATALLHSSRAWLGLHAGMALALAVTVRTPW
ncbi:MAG: hypothetical protein ACRDZ3_13945 [Acidimicrobiia bacterium]